MLSVGVYQFVVFCRIRCHTSYLAQPHLSESVAVDVYQIYKHILLLRCEGIDEGGGSEIRVRFEGSGRIFGSN